MGKYRVIQECERMNQARKVRRGSVHHSKVFETVRGSLLMSGKRAANPDLLLDLLLEFEGRGDYPTVLLTTQKEILERLQSQQRIPISGNGTKNYHPMYGMNKQQVCKLIQHAAEEIGSLSIFDSLLPYVMAVLDIVSIRYPVSLPSLEALMECDDEYIANLALQYGLSQSTSDCIRGNCEAGIYFRRVLRHLRRTFENIAVKESETTYNLVTNVRRGPVVMAVYQLSQNQELFNLYLKEELYAALTRCRRIRVVLHEVFLRGEEDELLQFLMQMKRQNRIELIACSEGAEEMLGGNVADFENVCMFLHRTIPMTERLSERIFGKYAHGSLSVSIGTPPALFFSLRKDERWSRQQEERLRVRAVDLWEHQEERLAIKLWNYEDIYLVSVKKFGRG